MKLKGITILTQKRITNRDAQKLFKAVNKLRAAMGGGFELTSPATGAKKAPCPDHTRTPRSNIRNSKT